MFSSHSFQFYLQLPINKLDIFQSVLAATLEADVPFHELFDISSMSS